MAKKEKPRYTVTVTIDGPEGKTVSEEERTPPSVTTIIDKVYSESFGPGAWWGYKVGGARILGIGDLSDDRVLELYERMKADEVNGKKITPNSIRDEAGDRGKLAHKVQQQLVMGKTDVPHVLQLFGDNPYVVAGTEWFKDHFGEGETIATELQLYHRRLDYVGTFDYLRLCTDGVEELIDWKTTKPPIRFKQHVQLAAYDFALPPMFRRHRVVLLQPDGKYVESTQEMRIEPQFFERVLEQYERIKRWEEAA